MRSEGCDGFAWAHVCASIKLLGVFSFIREALLPPLIYLARPTSDEVRLH